MSKLNSNSGVENSTIKNSQLFVKYLCRDCIHKIQSGILNTEQYYYNVISIVRTKTYYPCDETFCIESVNFLCEIQKLYYS